MDRPSCSSAHHGFLVQGWIDLPLGAARGLKAPIARECGVEAVGPCDDQLFVRAGARPAHAAVL